MCILSWEFGIRLGVSVSLELAVQKDKMIRLMTINVENWYQPNELLNTWLYLPLLCTRISRISCCKTVNGYWLWMDKSKKSTGTVKIHPVYQDLSSSSAAVLTKTTFKKEVF